MEQPASVASSITAGTLINTPDIDTQHPKPTRTVANEVQGTGRRLALDSSRDKLLFRDVGERIKKQLIV
jgi:hypothetical protein